MAIKSWSCPGCHKDFIVDAESARDTCPWCKATVEEKGGDLRVVTAGEKPAEAANPGTAQAAAPEGQPAGSGAASSGTNSAGTQSWWPFEFSS